MILHLDLLYQEYNICVTHMTFAGLIRDAIRAPSLFRVAGFMNVLELEKKYASFFCGFNMLHNKLSDVFWSSQIASSTIATKSTIDVQNYGLQDTMQKMHTETILPSFANTTQKLYDDPASFGISFIVFSLVKDVINHGPNAIAAYPSHFLRANTNVMLDYCAIMHAPDILKFINSMTLDNAEEQAYCEVPEIVLGECFAINEEFYPLPND